MAQKSKNRGVARCYGSEKSDSESSTFTARDAQKAVQRLWRLYRDWGSWREVGRKTGINFATADYVANGKRPVNIEIIRKLGIQSPKRYYKNWRLKCLMLRKYIRRLHAKE